MAKGGRNGGGRKGQGRGCDGGESSRRREDDGYDRAMSTLREIEARSVELRRRALIAILMAISVGVIVQKLTGILLGSSPLLWGGYAGIIGSIFFFAAIVRNPTEETAGLLTVGCGCLAVTILIIALSLAL